MKLWLSSICLSASFTLCSARATPYTARNSSIAVRDDNAACKEVAKVYEAARRETPDIVAGVPVDPLLAYECLNSIKLVPDDAKKMIEYIKRTVVFQSNLAYLKKPELANSERASVDVVDILETAKEMVDQEYLETHYDLEKFLESAFSNAGDDHFSFQPSLTSIYTIQFARPGSVGLVSVSSNGLEVPKVYLRDDIDAGDAKAILLINDSPPQDLFSREKGLESFADANTQYQAFFQSTYEWANSPGQFLLPRTSVGATTKFTFEDGTVKEVDNLAYIQPSGFAWLNILQGTDPYDALVSIKLLPKTEGEAETGIQEVQSIKPSGEIQPDPSRHKRSPGLLPNGLAKRAPISDDLQNIIKFFTVGPDKEEIAVLQLSTFEAWFSKSHLNSFRADLASKKTKKLIIDLQNNMGGNQNNMEKALQLLFPFSDWSAVRYRMRNSEILRKLLQAGQGTAPYSGAVPRPGSGDRDPWINALTKKPFATLPEFFSPNELDEDSFCTQTCRAPPPIPPKTPQLFSPENIVLFSNGICSGNCALFVEFLTQHPALKNRVKLISVGGLPEPAPHTVVGGVKGGPLIVSRDLFNYVDDLVDAGKLVRDDPTDFDMQFGTGQPFESGLRVGMTVNLADWMRPSVPFNGGVIPAQFVYDASHCRLFYTRDMILDENKLYDRVYDAGFGEVKVTSNCCGSMNCACGLNPAVCVKGSFRPPVSGKT